MFHPRTTTFRNLEGRKKVVLKAQLARREVGAVGRERVEVEVLRRVVVTKQDDEKHGVGS